jgi:hypothetical protein
MATVPVTCKAITRIHADPATIVVGHQPVRSDNGVGPGKISREMPIEVCLRELVRQMQ